MCAGVVPALSATTVTECLQACQHVDDGSSVVGAGLASRLVGSSRGFLQPLVANCGFLAAVTGADSWGWDAPQLVFVCVCRFASTQNPKQSSNLVNVLSPTLGKFLLLKASETHPALVALPFSHAQEPVVLISTYAGKEHALLICNHRSDVDWLVGWVLAQVC